MPQLSLVCRQSSLLLRSQLTCHNNNNNDPDCPDVCPAEGKALMFLLPSEQEAMLRRLAHKHIPINGIKANPSKTQEITGSPAGPAVKDTGAKGALLCWGFWSAR